VSKGWIQEEDDRQESEIQQNGNEGVRMCPMVENERKKLSLRKNMRRHALFHPFKCPF
jgi:hypothetical protein